VTLVTLARVVLRKLQSLAFDPFVGQNPEVPASHDLASPSDSDQEKYDDPLDIYLHLTIPLLQLPFEILLMIARLLTDDDDELFFAYFN
jgi:hypothetical protein